MSKTRILIADDHAIVRLGRNTLLSEEPDFEVVGDARNSVQAIAQALRLKPDIVVLTDRQEAVLRAVTKGLSNADIARQEGLAEITVKNHLTRAFKKTRGKHPSGSRRNRPPQTPVEDLIQIASD